MNTSFLCLRCQIIAGRLMADFVWRLVRQGLVGSFAVGEPDVTVYCPDKLRRAFVFIDIEVFVLDAAEEAFRHGVIQSLPLVIHGNLYVMVFQKLDVVRVREMAPLIGVDHLRLSVVQSSLQASKYERLLQTVAEFVGHDLPGIPVNDDIEVDKASFWGGWEISIPQT